MLQRLTVVIWFNLQIILFFSPPSTSSLGLEVLEDVPDADVVVVCCGGGGLLAGVAAAIKLSGCHKTRIYGVEPEGGKK